MSQDICKMTLCLAGINGVDLYRMKKTAYYDGILHYERAKTRTRREDKAYIEIRVPDMLIPTIEKYLSDEKDEYLFKFHKMFLNDRNFVASQSHEIRLICLKRWSLLLSILYASIGVLYHHFFAKSSFVASYE